MLFSHLFNSLKILSSHVYYFFISVIEQAWKKKRIPGKINHFAVNLATKI